MVSYFCGIFLFSMLCSLKKYIWSFQPVLQIPYRCKKKVGKNLVGKKVFVFFIIILLFLFFILVTFSYQV